MKQHHKIEIFSANCPLCKHITDDIQIGKCEGCNQIVYDINNMTEEIKVKMRDYGVKAVPTTVIDGNIKVVGIPDFPWICGEDLMAVTRLANNSIFANMEAFKRSIHNTKDNVKEFSRIGVNAAKTFEQTSRDTSRDFSVGIEGQQQQRRY